MKETKRTVTEAQDATAIQIDDSFVEEALERFKTGKLSKEALVAVLNIKMWLLIYYLG